MSSPPYLAMSLLEALSVDGGSCKGGAVDIESIDGDTVVGSIVG